MKKSREDATKQRKGEIGKVASVKMQQTVIVAVERFVRHPIYKKALRRTRRFAADSQGFHLAVGDVVRIIPTRPISRRKHFKIAEKVAL